MLSSICFMPASLTPQSLPPFSPNMAWYLGESMVVTCMRAGLYQTKKGLLVFLGSLRSRKSTTLAEISSSTVRERSRVSGPSSLQVWFASVPSDEWHQKPAEAASCRWVFWGPQRQGLRAIRESACFCMAGQRTDRWESC